MAESSRATRHMLKAADDGSIDDYSKWVSRGADISGTDKKGQNALHLLVKQGKFIMLQHVLNSQPEVRHLVNKVDDKGWSPLHLCCIQHPVELRTLEWLLTVGGDPTLENKCGNCKDLVDKDAKEFLHWRKRHHKGLPRDIKLLPNEYIMEYMRKFGHLDDDFTITYDRILEEGQVESTDIQIIISGSQGVGKTALSQSLLGLKVKKNGQNRTKCMQMFPKRFTIDLDDGTRYDNGDATEYATCLQAFVDNVLKRMEASGTPRSETWLKRHLSTRPGQEVVVSKKKTRGKSEKANVSILDFSGDDVYQGIQHLFMTSHGVYILVFSLQQYPQLGQMLEGIYVRLRYISLFDENKRHPDVVLVGTHLDKVPDSSQKYETINAQIKAHLKEHQEIEKFAHEHVQGIFLVNNLDLPQEVRDEIWQTTIRAATHGPQCRQLVPARWLALERELYRYRASGHKIMTFGNVCTIAKEMAVPIQEDEQVADFLRFLHQRKSILICKPSLSITSQDPIAVDTRWMISRLTDLLTVKQPYVSPEFMKSFLQCDNKEETPRNKKGFMLSVSQLFLIAEPLPAMTENKANYYVVPCMLPPANDQLIKSLLLNQGKSTLCFISNHQFIPPAVRDKLLTMCINRFEVLFDPISRERLLYRHSACFIVNPGLNLALQCSKSTIKLTLFSCTGCILQAGFGNFIRESVVDLFEDRTRFECHLLYEDGPRKISVKVSDQGLFSQQTVPLPQDPSQDSAIWFVKFQKQPDNPMTGNSLDAQQNHELSPKRLSHVAKHIGNCYAVVLASLRVETTVVEQERCQNKNLDFRSQLTKILLRWRAMQKGGASLQKLIEVMKLNNIPHKEMILDPVWTSETTMTTVKDGDASVIPGIDVSSSPTSDDLAVIAGIVGSSFLVFFLELDVDYLDIQKAMELHRRQSEKVLTMYLLEVWGQRLGSKATFYRIIRAMKETNLDTSQLKHINPRSSHC